MCRGGAAHLVCELGQWGQISDLLSRVAVQEYLTTEKLLVLMLFIVLSHFCCVMSVRDSSKISHCCWEQRAQLQPQVWWGQRDSGPCAVSNFIHHQSGVSEHLPQSLAGEKLSVALIFILPMFPFSVVVCFVHLNFISHCENCLRSS